MFSLEDWKRPSSLVLAAVLAANLLLPLMHFWPQDAGADEAGARPNGGDKPGEEAPPPAPVSAVTHPGPETEDLAMLSQPIEPIVMTLPPKRAAPRRPVEVCRAWGPFTDPGEAQSVAGRLGLAPASIEIREGEAPGSPDFLVKVHAQGSREAVSEMIADLKRREVESYVLERMEGGSVLAAGVFRRASRAESLRRMLAELGYQALVETLERPERVYHLVARLPDDRVPEVPPAGDCGDIAPPERFL